MTLKRRLIGAFGASVLGPFVTIFVQSLNVPVMLRLWGDSALWPMAPSENYPEAVLLGMFLRGRGPQCEMFGEVFATSM